MSGAADQLLTRQDPVGNWTIQLENTDELTASFQVGLIQTSCSSSPSPPSRPRGRERAVVFTGADAASPFQRRSSAAPALFLIVGTGTAADRGLKWRGLIDFHGGSPAVGALRQVLRQGDAGLVEVIENFLAASPRS